MKQEITVEEQFGNSWKTIAYLSSAVALFLFIAYLLTEDPLWEGIFRFIAFLGLIGAVFSFLRLRDGQKKVQMVRLEEQLKVTYHRKGKMLKEELFERSTIKKIYSGEANSVLPMGQKGYQFFITFTDTENRLGLFKYSGRNLRFSKEEAEKIDIFLAKNLNAGFSDES